MTTEENLNTESNDIAGNRVSGPAGNTATQPSPPSGGPVPVSGAPVSSEQLAAAETSAGQGGVDNAEQQENKEADPADLTPASGAPAAAGQPGTYGGNFSNSTQDVYHDADRANNQEADASRGEFGRQGPHATHGGYGNQYREADYEPHQTAEDKYYGGPGLPGPQHNAYRPDPAQLAHANPVGPNTPPPVPEAAGPDGRGNQQDTRNLTNRADARANQQNDNSAGPGQGPGFATDYGHTSVGGGAARSTPSEAPAGAPRRNQGEDDRSSRGGYDNQGSAAGPGGSASTGAAPAPPATGGTPGPAAAGEGYGDRGRQGEAQRPDYQTNDERNGFGNSANSPRKAEGEGFGSQGGSYDDQYAAGQPGATGGSPAKGDYTQQQRDAHNSGEAAQENFRSDAKPDANADDTAPHRNAGRNPSATGE